MRPVDPQKLNQFEETKNVLAPILALGKEIFSIYLNHDVEVYIHSSAILDSPPTDFENPQKPQVMHADHVGFTAITVLIMLTEEGGDSTHILDAQDYGPDVNKHRDALLNFNPDEKTWRKRPIRPEVRDAIKNRYHTLLELSPREFFNQACNSRMTYGQGEIFRTDIMHAGPFSPRPRTMFFVEMRVVGEAIPPMNGVQYRFPLLMKIAGYTVEEIAKFQAIWVNANYFFP